MLKIVVLNDNRNRTCNLKNEHGLSLYIEYDDYKMLFDVGQTDIYIQNAKRLNCDLEEISSIVLSHGHYDHGNGLVYINNIPRLICHPNVVNKRISKRTGIYGGLNESLDELNKRFKTIFTANPYEITTNIYYLGQIERKLDFEAKQFPMNDENGADDIVLDDTGIVIKTKNGLIVISGCAHSGICNTVEYAKKVAQEEKICAVIGGFHLKECDEDTEKTIQYMSQNGVQKIYLAHCTSDSVCDKFKSEKGDIVKIVSVGDTYIFDN